MSRVVQAVDAEPDAPKDARRIADLDDDTVVLISTTRRGKRVHRAECNGFRDARASISVRVADLPQKYELCSNPECWPTEPRPGVGEHQCPCCGEVVKRLPMHLPCDGGDSE